MSKKWYVIGAILFLVGLIGLLATKFNFDNSKLTTFSEEWQLEADEIESLAFMSGSTDFNIKFTESKDEYIHVSIDGKANEKIIEEIKRASVNNHDFIVDITEVENQRYFLISIGFNNEKRININIATPQNYNLTHFLTETTSGDLKISNLSASTSDISSTSGEIKINNSHVVTSNIVSTSGDVDIEKHTGDIKLDATSGDVEIEQLSGQSSIQTTSGDVEVEQHDDSDLTVTVKSGDVEAIRHESGNVTINSTSGDVKVSLPKDYSGIFELDTNSGDTTRNLSQSFSNVGNAKYIVSVQTTSGDIKIKQKYKK